MFFVLKVERPPLELLERLDKENFEDSDVPAKSILCLIEGDTEKVAWHIWQENKQVAWGGWGIHYKVKDLRPYHEDCEQECAVLVDCTDWSAT